MDAREYLNQIYKLQKKIEHMKFLKAEYDRLASSAGGPVYDKPFIDKSRSLEAPFIKWLDKSFEIEKLINSESLKQQKLIDEAMTKIQKIENTDHQKVLTLRYLEFQTWNDICNTLYISSSTCKRWHREGLLELEKHL